MTACTVRPVAAKQKEQFTPSFSSLTTIVVPIDQRKWKDSPDVEYVDGTSLSFCISECEMKMTLDTF